MPKSKAKTVNKIEFRTLAEDAPVMLWLTNSQGDIIFSNSMWKNFVGAEKVDNQGGDAWYDALHPDDRARCVQIFRDAFNTHHNFEMEYRLKRRDGQYRIIRDTGEPYISNHGKFSGFIGSSTDITEQKCFEEQLKRSHQDMELHNNEMRLVNKLNSYLQICRTMEETYPVILYYASELFPRCTGALYLLNNAKNIVECVASWGDYSEEQIRVMTPDDCWSLRQGKNHTVNDVNHGLVCHHVKNEVGYGYTCVPIIAQGDMIGMVHLQFPKLNEELSKEEITHNIEAKQRLVNMAADNLALSLVSLRLREALKIQSVKDPLTGLFNRRYMEETIEREYSRCKRTGDNLGVLMLDIDHFKSYNDTHGHDVGDMILSELSKLLQDKTRKNDIACRYGGEEFLIIMPGIPVDILVERAKQFNQAVGDMSINCKNEVFDNVTVSVGVAAFPTHASNTVDLIKAADGALYRAKNNGRNRVEVANILARRKNDVRKASKSDSSIVNLNSA